MKKIFVLIVITTLFIACKKEEPTPNNSAANAPVTVKTYGNINYNQTITYDGSGNLSTSVLGFNCKFFENGVSQSAVTNSNGSDVGSVYVNNKITKKNTNFIYVDSGYVYQGFPVTYSITGAGNFTNTSFTDNGVSYATTSNFSSFTNTISKSAGVSYTLNNVSNVYLATFYIGTTSFSVANNVISISAGQMANIPSTNATTVSLVLLSNNPNNSTFSGKNYAFNHGITYVKTGIVITP